MTSTIDPLGLNEMTLFKELKNSLPQSAKETRNILEIREDILFVWHAEKFCIHSMIMTSGRGKEEDIPHQTFQPSDPPLFDVSHLVINETVSQLALWGNLGIAVVSLPKRWGRDGKFEGGKPVISCLSHNLNCCGSQLSTKEVRKARWHPGSTRDSHLVVLTSDNVFRLYECNTDSKPKLLKTWKVGPSVHSPSKIPNFASLGDTAVDFDFATPTAKLETNKKNDKVSWNDIEWPILVLRGNGEVLIVRGNVLVGDFAKPVVLGSLAMYPASVDNYGVESCSIMCLPTTPPIVIIAACTGRIYHAILLRENLEDDEKKYGSNYSLHAPEDALYVFECVELELGLFYTDEDKKYSCPILLHPDKSNRSRYFCSHNAGIHIVNMTMVSQLDDFISANEDNLDLHLPALDKQSNSEYLITTRTKYTGENEDTPVLGFGLLEEPCLIIALLHTGIVVNRSIVDFYCLPKITLPNQELPSFSKEVRREPFDFTIQQLLKHESSQPLTITGQSGVNHTPREYLEILDRTTTLFRKHLVRHDQVREEFSKKVRALKVLKNHQLKELASLIEEKKDLQQTAEHLAERYEDIKDKQEELARRAEASLRFVNLKAPFMTPVERSEAEGIKKMSQNVKDLAARLEKFKKKVSTTQTTNDAQNDLTESQLILSDSQVDTISSTLMQISEVLADLTTRVKTLQNQVEL